MASKVQQLPNVNMDSRFLKIRRLHKKASKKGCFVFFTLVFFFVMDDLSKRFENNKLGIIDNGCLQKSITNKKNENIFLFYFTQRKVFAKEALNELSKTVFVL